MLALREGTRYFPHAAMELHHKLRRDPNWHPSGCNICGQVWLDFFAIMYCWQDSINYLHRSVHLFWNMRACAEPSCRAPLLCLNQKMLTLLLRQLRSRKGLHPVDMT